MWNPDTYRDTDYGLDPGEAFEPIEEVDDDFTPGSGQPYVQTVLGPIRPEEVGVALVREFLHGNGVAEGKADPDEVLGDRIAVLGDLEAFFSVSGRTVVSATPAMSGRNDDDLRWLASHAPVHLVAAAGFGPHHQLERAYAGTSAESMRVALDRDFDTGEAASAVLPGLLVAAYDPSAGSRLERQAVDLVAEAHRSHDVPICLQTSARGGQELLQVLNNLGVPPGRVILAFERVPGIDVLEELAHAGVFVLVDGIGNPEHAIDRSKSRAIAKLFELGLGDRIVVSHGYKRRSQLTGYGGRPGFPYVVEQFAVMLMEDGLDATNVRHILVDNAARALTINKPDIAARA